MTKDNYYDEIFARNYDRFTTGGYYDYKKEAAEFKKLVAGKGVLEIGIGTGALAEELLKYGYRIEGIEPSAPMVAELAKKKLPITVHKQDAAEFSTGKQYDAIYTHGAVPFAVDTGAAVRFYSYLIDDKKFRRAMGQVLSHLKPGGLFLCGVQPGSTDNASVGDFYRNETRFDGNVATKTHYFREGKRWVSQTVTHRVWPERDYADMMEGVGFKSIGCNKSRTWFVFRKP